MFTSINRYTRNVTIKQTKAAKTTSQQLLPLSALSLINEGLLYKHEITLKTHFILTKFV